MKSTITIDRGNQYNARGYRITDGTLWGFGTIATRMDGSTGLTRDGNCRASSPEIEEAIRATLIDGLTRMIEIDDGRKPQAHTPRKAVCPICHTYCNGDCQAQ